MRADVETEEREGEEDAGGERELVQVGATQRAAPAVASAATPVVTEAPAAAGSAPAEAPAVTPDAEAVAEDEDEVKPEPEFAEEEFAKELEGLDEQDKMMGDALMTEINAALIKQLRDATNAGMMECKRALEATDGDLEKATDWLRQKGITKAAERSGRAAGEGVVVSYVHRTTKDDPDNLGKVGVLVEVNSESDFVARNEIFQTLARELALQVASMAPLYVRREEVPQALVEREREVALAQAREQGKEAMADKIAEGKLNAFFSGDLPAGAEVGQGRQEEGQGPCR